MASVKKLSRSFARGEVTPQLDGRDDLPQFQTGLQTCRNYIVRPHGVVDNRPGTQYVATTKNNGVISRLLSFSFNNVQTFAIEMGVGYFRFFTNGATLLYGTPAAYSAGTAYIPGNLVTSGGSVYYCIAPTTGNAPPNVTYWYLQPATGQLEVPNSYTALDLFNVHYVQSNDVMTLTHPNYPASELSRLSAVNWSFLPISFGDTVAVPTGVTATPTGGGATNYQYVVTTINTGDLQESVASAASANITNDLTIAGHTNAITWTAATNAIQYNVYRLMNGLYGFIGNAGGTSFTDNNITPDVSTTPPYVDDPFVDNTTYPAEVSYFQQRRYFAASNTLPQTFWATRSGTESNLTYSIPARDDDRLSFRIAARDANSIRHLIPLSVLIMLTASGEWQISSTNGGAITPSNILVTPQSYIGASNVAPCIVNKGIIYAAARGGRVRELLYNWQLAGYASNDISKLAIHLFDNYTIADMAYAKAPYPVVWCVSSGGNLLGLTYQPEDQIAGWHRHDTLGGTFESICVVSEGNEDILYAIVNRTINGVQSRFVERLASRNFDNVLANAYFVDCGATYNSAPATVISGLTWLIGATVNILADGAVSPSQVVDNTGSITLPVAASVVTVGLPITADFQTLPFSMDQVMASARGSEKNVNKVWLRVDNSSGMQMGPSFDELRPYKQRTTEPYGTPPMLISGELNPQNIDPKWAADGELCVRQSDPLPLTIVCLTMEIAITA